MAHDIPFVRFNPHVRQGEVNAMGKLAQGAHHNAQRLGEGADRALVILGSGLNEEGILDAHLASNWRHHEHAFGSGFDVSVPPKGGHPGTFVLSEWDGVPVVVSRGRVHLFQVWMQQQMLWWWMAAAIALMGKGRRAIITNAVGGLKPYLKVGSIVVPPGSSLPTTSRARATSTGRRTDIRRLKRSCRAPNTPSRSRRCETRRP